MEITAAAEPNLKQFLHPRTIALIGATDNPHRPGYALFRKVRAKMEKEGGKIFPVNPRLQVIDGIPCYPHIAAIPEPVDVGVIMIGDVVGALQECIGKKVKFAVIFTAGFAEVGEKGAALQEKICQMAREGGVRLFGPNTNVNAFETFQDLPGRKIALITQSGHQGRPIVQGEALGIGFSYWVPTGNEADLEACDFIEYFVDHEETGAIAAYIEGFKDGEKLKRVADYAARRGKPIVLIKVGRSAEGERMAMAHTGHLTGADAVHEAFFQQYGLIRVDDLDELLETAALFTRLPKPAGDGVCIYAISGGTGALMADLCGLHGIKLPVLSPTTQEALREFIPEYLTVHNPVDNGATPIHAGHGPKILDLLLADPHVDLLVCPITGALPPMSDVLAQELVTAFRTGKKPMVAIWGSPKFDERAYQILVEGGIPLFRSFRNCVKAVKAFLEYYRWIARYASLLGSPSAPSLCGDPGIARLLARGGTLSERESKELLSRYGIPVTQEVIATSEEEAVRAARHIGFPVVVKISSPDIPHKSEAGLVYLGAGEEGEVRKAFATLRERARRHHPQARIDGVLVQEMMQGVEVIVGVSTDPLFGHTLLFGLGGIYVEVLKDVSLRTIPLTRRDVEAMVEEIRGYPILAGTRGQKPRDRNALIEVMLRVADMARDLKGRLRELDINPLMVLEEGKGVKAVDALVVLGDTPASSLSRAQHRSNLMDL